MKDGVTLVKKDLPLLEKTEKKLIQSYKFLAKNKFPIPKGLVGTIGEISVLIRILNKPMLKNRELKYFGGGKQFDILFDGKKIDVKTFSGERIGSPSGIKKRYGCPSTSKKTLKICDYIVLVIFEKSSLKYFLVFSKRLGDFKYFSEIGCWSRNRKVVKMDKGNKDKYDIKKKHDKTIMFIEDYDESKLSKTSKEMVRHYVKGKKDYKKIWKKSLDAWHKLL